MWIATFQRLTSYQFKEIKSHPHFTITEQCNIKFTFQLEYSCYDKGVLRIIIWMNYYLSLCYISSYITYFSCLPLFSYFCNFLFWWYPVVVPFSFLFSFLPLPFLLSRLSKYNFLFIHCLSSSSRFFDTS